MALQERKGSNNAWLTPEKYLRPVRAYAPIGLDPCTEDSNPAGAEHYYTAEDDGLVQDWGGYGLVFVNPPYSTVSNPNDGSSPDSAEAKREAKRKFMAGLKQKGEDLFGVRKVSSLIVLWMLKLHREVAKGNALIALLPCGARFGTDYWQEHALNHELSAICFVRGRIPFIDGRTGGAAKGNMYDSAFYGYNVDADRFGSAFRETGVVLRTRKHRVGLLDGFM